MPDNCRRWQGLLAEHALTTRPPHTGTDVAMDDGLADHLAGCVECQAAAAEFRSIAEALSHTDATSAGLVANAAPAGLTRRITARVDDERRRHDRRRRYAAVSAAAATLLIVVSVLALRPSASNDTPVDRVALATAAIQGEATLQPRAWGTQIHLAGTGFIPGQPYNVWLEEADGTHVAAGTFTGVRNTQITVVLASALPPAEAVAIGISKPDGTLIVRAPLD